MKLFKISSVIGILCSLTYCNSVKTSSVKHTVIKESTFKTVEKSFPKSWIGTYKGTLHIYDVDSVRMTANMQLDVSRKTDSIYNWTITYLINNKEDVRPYELQIINSKEGKYLMDEKNSIKIEVSYHNKIVTSFFKVMDSFIVATYIKKDENIVFEIISASNKDRKITGNSKHKGQDIPKVVSYYVNGRQRAILKKTEL